MAHTRKKHPKINEKLNDGIDLEEIDLEEDHQSEEVSAEESSSLQTHSQPKPSSGFKTLSTSSSSIWKKPKYVPAKDISKSQVVEGLNTPAKGENKGLVNPASSLKTSGFKRV